MPARIKIVTGPGTEQSGQELAAAIQERFGMSATVVHPPNDVNLRDSEKLGRILDTLAVLRETEATLCDQATRLIAQHPELTTGSETLTLHERIENTISNRTVVQATYGDQRPVHPPEEFILAGAAVAMGGTAQHLGSLVYLTAQHASTTEAQFREGLNFPERSTIELGRQIQARIDHPTIRNRPEPEAEAGD